LQDIKEFASGFESKFNPYEQHDAQEFFLHLVNALQEEMKT
jgi:ubiquitin C-terminal hydrolase